MQLINIYLYRPVISAQVITDPTILTRNNVVYAKNIKLYKGVDNVFVVQFKNQDQKAVNVLDKIVRFHILKEQTNSAFTTLSGTIIDGAKGIVQVMVPEAELNALRSSTYQYSISMVDVEGNATATYTNDNYGVRGTLELHSGHYPEYRDSSVLNINAITNISDSVSATATYKVNTTHTFQAFFNLFTGSVILQATLDGVANSLDTTWFDIQTIAYIAQTKSEFINFVGNYTFVRIKLVPAVGTMTKLLYRG